jgi:hypothetical protein
LKHTPLSKKLEGRTYGRQPAETAHRVTIRLANVFSHLLPRPPVDDPRLGVDVLGLRFPNPIGLAAGFDKDALNSRRSIVRRV